MNHRLVILVIRLGRLQIIPYFMELKERNHHYVVVCYYKPVPPKRESLTAALKNRRTSTHFDKIVARLYIEQSKLKLWFKKCVTLRSACSFVIASILYWIQDCGGFDQERIRLMVQELITNNSLKINCIAIPCPAVIFKKHSHYTSIQ